MELETINKLYLELSQITTATTAREILLQKQLAEAQRDSERYHFLAGFGVTAHSPRWAHWRIERWTKDGWEPIYGNLMNAAIDAAKGESNGTVRAERSGFDTLPDDYKTGDY